jgi:YXWGXW repeat-containing protein
MAGGPTGNWSRSQQRPANARKVNIMRIARFILSLLLAAGILAIPVPSRAQVAVGISVRIGPPALPVYAQPICPGPEYIWVPGYWAYGDDDYFWVPGTWVLAPEPGLLWTPGYWGWNDGFYIWHTGYWGPRVGFYGGINYGFGYPGTGFYGGYWRGRNYYYNRSVTNVNVTVIHNVYEKRINERNITRVSFNGGPGGINRRPDRDERRAEHERHVSMTSEQSRHFEAARGDRNFRASVNHGRPEVAATERPGRFERGRDEDRGRGNDRNRPSDIRESNRSGRPFDNSERNSHDRPERGSENNGRDFDRPPSARHSDRPSSNPRLEEKHQRDFDKMQHQQDAERQKMQRQQEREQQKMERQRPNQQRQDQLQRRQQQQMDQMNRKHDQQAQKMQQRQEREHQGQQKQEGKPHGNGHDRP